MVMIYWSNYLPRPAEIRIKNPQTLPRALYIYIYIILIYTLTISHFCCLQLSSPAVITLFQRWPKSAACSVCCKDVALQARKRTLVFARYFLAPCMRWAYVVTACPIRCTPHPFAIANASGAGRCCCKRARHSCGCSRSRRCCRCCCCCARGCRRIVAAQWKRSRASHADHP